MITGSDETEIKNLKAFLGSEFQTKDLGPLKYFLGLRSTALGKEFVFLNENIV